MDDLVRFVMERGEPCYKRFRSPEALVNASDSPLKPQEKESLIEFATEKPAPSGSQRP